MRRRLLVEVLVLTLLAAAGGVLLAWRTGEWGWSWDALNHHIYLGMVAEGPRWQFDVVPASYQTYQYPYLYWPVYRLSQLSGSGLLVAMAWTATQAALLLPPIWLLAYRLLDQADRTGWEAVAQRTAACALAYMNGVVLLGLNMTSNDILASLPLVWALALHLGAPASTRRAFWCAALYGAATAFKWSNGIMLPLLLFWWWCPHAPRFPVRRGLALAAGAVAGFSLTYLPWGWQLLRVTGNPFYPYFQTLFGGY